MGEDYRSFLTVVYGSNYGSERNQLWNELRHINRTFISNAWAVLRDFNCARFTDNLSFAKLASFNDCIANCQLIDLKHVGSKWSWHNNNVGSGRIVGSFDRVLCNHLWIDTLANSFYEYHNHATNDHAPMVLHLIEKINSGPKPFRYFNY